MSKPHSILVEESLQKDGSVYINESHAPPHYKPVYYSDELETGYSELKHRIQNVYRRYRRFLSSFLMQEYYSPAADMKLKLRKKFVLVRNFSLSI